MTTASVSDDRAAALRLAFDRGFADSVGGAAIATEDFLAIQVGGAPHVVRLAEIAGLFSDRRITPLPTAVATLLGLVGSRGAIVPVYDLAALLAVASPAGTAPRWIVIAAAAPIALAFDGFEHHLRVPRTAIAVGGGRQVVDAEGAQRPVVDVGALLIEIAHRERTSHV